MARPKRVFTDEEIEQMEQYARSNCLTNTIAVALGIPLMTLKRHFGKKLKQWRACGKVELRENQRRLAKISPDMAKFLGKNVLEQVDKQEIKTETTVIQPTEAEHEALRPAIKLFKEGLA